MEKKICELVRHPFQLKSASGFKKYLEKKNQKLELLTPQWERPEEIFHLAVDQMETADFIRLDIDLSPVFLEQYGHAPEDIRQIMGADCLVKQNGFWWPRFHMMEALRSAIVEQAKTINIRQSAYIIGEGAWLRGCLAVMSRLGYSQIYLVSEDFEWLQSHTEEISGSFMGTKLHPLETNSLTLQTVGANIMVNCYDLSSREGLATDLAYFNFMSRGSVVIDLNNLLEPNPLTEEAKTAGLQVIPTQEIYLRAETMNLQSCDNSLAIDSKELMECLRSGDT